MKRGMYLLLALVTLLLLLAGCGTSDDNSTHPANTSPAGDTTLPVDPTLVVPSAEEVAAMATRATVTVHTDDGLGTGFYIDDQGLLITCYHVIDGTTEIMVENSEGAYYMVDTIVDFSELLDIAILRARVSGNEYLEICKDPVVQGETVYALGSSRGLDGSFSNGMVSAVSRTAMGIECIQTNAAISSGNSGGPLMNKYGQVIGINAMTLSTGQNLNFAIQVSMLDEMSMDKNWSLSEYQEWYAKEVKRSYLVYDYDDETFSRSKIHTYQTVTGEDCVYSGYSWKYVKSGDWDMEDGYVDATGIFYYHYDQDEFDAYCDYLKSIGFVYDDVYEYRDWYHPGTSYIYRNNATGIYLDLYVFESEEWVVIEPRYD